MKNKKYLLISIDSEDIRHFFLSFGIKPKEVDDKLFEVAIERLLELFALYSIKATFFIVASDIENSNRRLLIERIRKAGHEIANHSYSHPKYMRLFAKKEVEEEIRRSTAILEETIGEKIVGFRAPYLSIGTTIFDVLEEMGYRYDSSIFPTPLAILQQVSYNFFMKREKIRTGFGSMLDFFAPIEPYWPGKETWMQGDRSILEIPISMTPCGRVPFYSSYHLTFGTAFINLAMKLGVNSLRWLGYSHHLLDVLDIENDKLGDEMKCYLPLRRTIENRKRLLSELFEQLTSERESVTMSTAVKIHEKEKL